MTQNLKNTLLNKIQESKEGNTKGILDLQTINNRDDKKEIWRLLSLLTVQERIAFLDFVVNQINQGVKLKSDPPWVLIEITNNTGDPNETYMDLMHVVSQYQIPWAPVLTTLERFVSHQSHDSISSQRRSEPVV